MRCLICLFLLSGMAPLSNGLEAKTPFLYSKSMGSMLPVITSVTPVVGPRAGGTEVIIKGFFPSAIQWVRFGNRYVPFDIVDSTTIRTYAPAGELGDVRIMVASRYGTPTEGIQPSFTYTLETLLAPAVLAGQVSIQGGAMALSLVWNESKSPDVTAYEVYKHDNRIAVVTSGLSFTKTLRTKPSKMQQYRSDLAGRYLVRAVNANGEYSPFIAVEVQ